jgi:AcrR family transcriptional regulator
MGGEQHSGSIDVLVRTSCTIQFLKVNASPDSQPVLDRLPSGRHRLTREAVGASQRGRLIVAIAEAVAQKGYGATTVTDIVERAGVSRSTFYEQFADKEACFLAAYETGVEFVLGKLNAAAEELPASDWRERVRVGLETYMDVLVNEPAFAWSLHVEVLRAGPAALERRAAIFGLFSRRTKRLYEVGRREDPQLPELPDELFQLHTGGIDELVRECLRTRGAEALPELAEPAVRTTLFLLGDTGSGF